MRKQIERGFIGNMAQPSQDTNNVTTLSRYQMFFNYTRYSIIEKTDLTKK